MQLYPHQKEALNLVKDKNKCAIYYDMGLGKTYIGSEKMVELGSHLNLVICQKSKIEDWINHFKENYNIECFNLTDKKALDNFLYWNNAKPESIMGRCPLIGIINYDLVWRRQNLLNLDSFTLLLDESSLITNRTAKRSKFILKMQPNNVILLSGTPTAGKYEKLWSQLKLLGWNISEDTFWKSYIDFEWVDRNGFFDRKVNGYKNIDHLKKRLAQFGAILKKTGEGLDLPEQIEQFIYVDPTNDYKKFCKNHYIEIEGEELIGDNTLTRILYERQLCGQYNPDKLKAFLDILKSTEDRLIVFYNFNEELSRMCKIAVDLDKPFSIINGSNKGLTNYNNYDNSVTFVQYQAGAYGLNLQRANKVIYYSLPLGIGSCDLWEQSKKRIHRIGQDRTCFYYYLITKDSIETWNLELLRTGKELTDELFKNNK